MLFCARLADAERRQRTGKFAKMIGNRCKKSVFSSDNAHDTSDVPERNVVRQRISDLTEWISGTMLTGEPIMGDPYRKNKFYSENRINELFKSVFVTERRQALSRKNRMLKRVRRALMRVWRFSACMVLSGHWRVLCYECGGGTPFLLHEFH